MFLNLGQRTQAQVWLDVQFPDFRMLAGMQSVSQENAFKKEQKPVAFFIKV